MSGLSEEFYALTDATLALNYEMTGSEPNKEAHQKLAPVSRHYVAKAKKLVHDARDSMLRLEALPAEVRAMDAECEARLRELGVTGFHEMHTADGRRFGVPEYFAAVAGALKDSMIEGCAGHA